MMSPVATAFTMQPQYDVAANAAGEPLTVLFERRLTELRQQIARANAELGVLGDRLFGSRPEALRGQEKPPVAAGMAGEIDNRLDELQAEIALLGECVHRLMAI